MFCNRFSLLMP